MSGNYEDFEEAAKSIVFNYMGFFDHQRDTQLLHAQFVLAEAYNKGYKQSLEDAEKAKRKGKSI